MDAMSFWDTVAGVLWDAGVELVVGLPTDGPGLLDAAAADPRMRALCVRDQRVGACAAAGYATVQGSPAALALSSGPAFANAMPGILEAASLGVPMVVVTIRVAAAEIGRGGFQELDQEAMSGQLVKWYARVELPERVGWALRQGVRHAVSGRPGVTVVELTDEVCHSTPGPEPVAGRIVVPRSVAAPAGLETAEGILRDARRPVVLAGGGARLSGAGDALRDIAAVLHAPLFTTAAGRGVADERDGECLGAAGLYVTPPLDRVQASADVVLVVGSRLEETVRMGWPELADQRIVHIDVDPAAFGQSVEPAVALCGDATLTVQALTAALRDRPWPHQEPRRQWLALARRCRAEALRPPGASLVRDALSAVTGALGSRVNLVHDNGLHDMWSYHLVGLQVSRETNVVVPGEQTMMGYGLGAAVGAQVAAPDRVTLAICGDGALGMAMQALPTLAELGSGTVVLAFDNRGFGWPRRGRLLAEAPTELTRFQVPVPVTELVRSFGGWADTVDGPDGLKAAAVTAAAAASDGRLALLTVRVSDDDVPVGVTRWEAITA